MSVKGLKRNEDGDFLDDARVEMAIPFKWLPILRYRFYLDHQPQDHLTVWWVNPISRYLGSYTPPPWFLKLIGQVK